VYRHHRTVPIMIGMNHVRNRYKSVVPVASRTETPLRSSNAMRPSSAIPAAPGMGETAMRTRTSEKATSISYNERFSAPKSVADVHKQKKAAQSVKVDALKM